MRARRSDRAGFALPLALFAIVLLSMIVALLLDGAVQELRVARGDLALARAQAAAEGALADLLIAPVDGAFLDRPRGTARDSTFVASGDTLQVTVQSLGGGLARVVVAARSWSGDVRADAGLGALFRAVPNDLAEPGPLRFRRLPGAWWSQLP